MKRFPSVKKNEEFKNAYEKGKSYANRYLVMYQVPNHNHYNRLGVSASKKVGNSVVRHHMARILREIFRLNPMTITQGWDIIVVVRQTAKQESYQTIESAYRHLMELHNKNKESK